MITTSSETEVIAHSNQSRREIVSRFFAQKEEKTSAACEIWRDFEICEITQISFHKSDNNLNFALPRFEKC